MQFDTINKKQRYDCIFIGTGVISILEAIYQSKTGKSVLMIDNKKSIGGAWAPINIFGFKNIENAIHYFLPDKNAEKYMRDFFGWNIFISNKKFQLRNIFFLGYKKLSYDGLTNRTVKIIQKETTIWKKTKNIIQLFINKINGNLKYSFYIKGGAQEIISYISKKLSNSKVELKLSYEINSIFLDKENDEVKLYSEQEIFYAKKIFLTHGSRVKAISSNDGPIKIIEKIHPRPAAHMLINDSSPNQFNELITDDSFIKYIHDVTHMIDKLRNKNKFKLLIFGMGHDVKFKKNIYEKIIIYLKKRGLIDKSATLVDGHWTDVILPTITDRDLEKIKYKNESLVEIIRTENFSKAIGLYASKWSSSKID